MKEREGYTVSNRGPTSLCMLGAVGAGDSDQRAFIPTRRECTQKGGHFGCAGCRGDMRPASEYDCMAYQKY